MRLELEKLQAQALGVALLADEQLQQLEASLQALLTRNACWPTSRDSAPSLADPKKQAPH